MNRHQLVDTFNLVLVTLMSLGMFALAAYAIDSHMQVKAGIVKVVTEGNWTGQ